MEELDSARQLVKEGDAASLEMLFDNLPQVFSELIRTAIIAPEGKTLIVADFSAIEARVIAWVAGENWKLQAFKDGKDLYCSTASAMFGVPVEKHGVNGDLRQKGKIAELACIAEGSLVLTDQGLVPIEQVATDMRVWDGVNWVEHEGVVYKGIKEVITYEGLTATPDHLVWVEGQQEPIQLGVASALGLHLIQTGDRGQAIRLGRNHKPRETVEQKKKPLLCAYKMRKLRVNPMADTGCVNRRKVKRMSELFTAETNPSMALQEINSSKAKVRKPSRQRIQKLWRKGYKIRLSECKRSRPVSDRDLWSAKQGIRDRQNRHKQRLCRRQSEVCRALHKLHKSAQMCSDRFSAAILALRLYDHNKETLAGQNKGRDHRRSKTGCERQAQRMALDRRQAPVYDIRNAGEHHCFTVSGHLVHNCGYGGSVGALKAFGAVEMGLKESELDSIVQSWRSANPNIVKLWWAVGNAALTLIKHRCGVLVINHKLKMSYQQDKLLIQLPSGRLLVYPEASIGENKFGGETMTYKGLNSVTHQWEYIDTYGPRLVENIVQAIARDLLTEAILRIQKNPDCQIVAHVHDEIIIEADPDKVTLDDMVKAMCELPEWGEGLILNAAGFTNPYYMKD